MASTPRDRSKDKERKYSLAYMKSYAVNNHPDVIAAHEGEHAGRLATDHEAGVHELTADGIKSCPYCVEDKVYKGLK